MWKLWERSARCARDVVFVQLSSERPRSAAVTPLKSPQPRRCTALLRHGEEGQGWEKDVPMQWSPHCPGWAVKQRIWLRERGRHKPCPRCPVRVWEATGAKQAL